MRIRAKISGDPDPNQAYRLTILSFPNNFVLVVADTCRAGRSFFRAEGFSCSLDVLNGGLGISKLQFFLSK